jgi:hypothetical protein
MATFDTLTHPIANFKRNEQAVVIGCNIMCLTNSKDFLAKFIDRNLENSLNLNDLKLDKDYTHITHQEAVQLVLAVEGGDVLRRRDHLNGPSDYVVTVDNLIKLMSIQQRLKYGLPVLIMGETGCGKTALVNFIASTLDFHLYTLDIHGGITDHAIMDFLDAAIESSANSDAGRGVLVFFDEINAANCMALFKTIIIDRMYGNKVIPTNVRIISACNPYRRRESDDMMGVTLVFQHQASGTSGITDPMRKLVYRVHPLPESLMDLVSDFGALSEKTEEIYIDAILRKELPKYEPVTEDESESEYDRFIKAFKKLLCESQSYVREVNKNERSVVSMRDIVRAARVLKWFLTYYSKLLGVPSPYIGDGEDTERKKLLVNDDNRPHLRNSVILTLGYCYHARLNRDQRWGYRNRICETWRKLVGEVSGIEWLNLSSGPDLEKLIVETQEQFVRPMDLGEGIALNEALRENLFMLLVSIMNQIPILLIGKPGCSKSLAMGVLQNNLNGEVSNKDFYRAMPSVEVFAYQCSPLSTPDAVINAFRSAKQSNLNHRSTIVCVLLDEVGLAEESPHLPLKVLHKELENLQGIACVGISNWALDAAKMSRCVTLYRPPPTVEDLCITAQGMVNSENLKGYLKTLSEAFFDLYRTQKKQDFWGMREFYSTIRVINAELERRAACGGDASVEGQILMKTVQRNFGGRPHHELDNCIEEFFERTGHDENAVKRYTTEELIKQNLDEPDARHLMLLTKNNAALRLLFESNLLDHRKAEVMFGSTFPNDQSDVFVAMNLQRIKGFMQRNISLVMVHCDSLYESLYDLLNQHYMEYAGQRYVRIAHGSKAKQCPIDRLFRVIVITEISDAYLRLAPPLLNRFEKQIFLRKDLMAAHDALKNRLLKFWSNLDQCVDPRMRDTHEEEVDEPESSSTYRPIAGFHLELISSLVFVLRRKFPDARIEELEFRAKKLLTWVLTPEAVCIVAATLTPSQRSDKFGFDIVDEYFKVQLHSDLPSYVQHLMTENASWCDVHGSQVMIMTYSPIRGKIASELKMDVAPVELALHELSSSTDIEKAVYDFYKDPQRGARCLLIHADPLAASVRMIEHCRFVCEKARSEFTQRVGDSASPDKIFVLLVVHLQRGAEGSFSFDFDSQWNFVFLDSVEASQDVGTMPSLGNMLNMPLIDVVEGLDFAQLLRQSFRSALSRLIYLASRTAQDTSRMIQQMLQYLNDNDFVDMVREWILHVLRSTPKATKGGDRTCTYGSDRQWFAAIASAAHELAMAGTFRAALHGRIATLVTSLLTVLLAHLDRNGGMAIFGDSAKRELWLKLASTSLTSPISQKLHKEAVQACSEVANAQHEVGTDAQTDARPFTGRFPSSWFVSKSITEARQIIDGIAVERQLPALQTQYQLSKLCAVGLDPTLEGNASLLDDYLHDFTAMHLDWTKRIHRDQQQRILKTMLQTFKGSELTSVLEVHQMFWKTEKKVAYAIALLNAVPAAVQAAEELIAKRDLENLDLDLLLLVYQALTDELLQSTDHPNQKTFYKDWNSRKLVVSGLTTDFLSTCDRTRLAADKLATFESTAFPRVETLSLYLQHVAIPLQLPANFVVEFTNTLPRQKLRSSQTLLAMVRMAQHLQSQASLQGKKSLCCFSACIEHWMLDVCLRDGQTAADVEKYCLALLCSAAAGLPVTLSNDASKVMPGDLEGWHENDDCGVAVLPGGIQIPRSQCLNLALLRKLLMLRQGSFDSENAELATATIEQLLQQISDHEGHHDSAFATKYTVLMEEVFAVGPDSHTWPDMSLQQVFVEHAATPHKMFQDIGRIRSMLSRYAHVLIQEPLNRDEHDAIVAKVDHLLQTTSPDLRPVCKSMRLFLLKCIERAKGNLFLRAFLVEEPLAGTPWVKEWRAMHDIDFEKFVGAARVPKWNPFTGDSAGQEYQVAKTAVLAMMSSESTQELKLFADDVRGKSEADQRKYIGALLLALAQEPGLLAALEEPHRRPPWRQTLNDWLANTKDLQISDEERVLLRIFAGDTALIDTVGDPATRSALEPFRICDGRKMEELLRWRVLAHLAANLIAAPPTSLLAYLRKLMLDPKSLSDLRTLFLPGMDEDMRNRVMKALLEHGENIWRFKSHWYKCVCGYSFFVGECGRPMEEARCPSCGAVIGGKDHEASRGSTIDDESDRSPEGYVLPCVSKDEKMVTFREIPATSARMIRLLLHGSMFCGLACHLSSSKESPRIFDHMVNQQSMSSLHQENEAEFIGAHWANDWAQMVELMSSNGEHLSVVMHSLLQTLGGQEKHEPKSASGAHEPWTDWETLNLKSRNSWEETLESKFLQNCLKNFDSCLATLYETWGGGSEDGKFTADLREAADVRNYAPHKRKEEMPQLWAFRSPVRMEALQSRGSTEADAKRRFPVLMHILQHPELPTLAALGTLSGFFQFQALLSSQFSGRITRQQAQEMTVSEVLRDLSPNERKVWGRAFAMFKAAWAIAWKFVERHECEELPAEVKRVQMTENTTLAYCIADERDEGICPTALMNWLQARHNELVRVVCEANREANEGPARAPAQGQDDSSERISSRLLEHHNTVNFAQDDLMRFLKNRCVTYGVGGKLNLDLDQLEQHLRQAMAKPQIYIEHKQFNWLGEQSGNTLNELHEVIEQRDLAEDVAERICSEISQASDASRCMQKVQMAVTFIMKSRAGFSTDNQAGDMLLSEYLRNVLSEEEDSLPTLTGRREVKLHHVDHFVKLLRSKLSQNPMDRVDPQYKFNLEPALEHALRSLDVPPGVADAMQHFAVGYLGQETVGANSKLVETLEHMPKFPSNDATDQLIKAFPQEIQMKHFAAVYNVFASM